MLRVLAISGWLLASALPAPGQQLPVSTPQNNYAASVEGAYGLNQNLINGLQYVNHYNRCLGNPYFMDRQLREGSLTINGHVFEDLLLKYDLVRQDLELEYRNTSGMVNRVIVIPDHVEAFEYGDYQFQKLELDDEGPRYYQVIRTETFTCYIHWFKNLVPVIGNTHFPEECSEENRVYLLEQDRLLHAFRNKKGFVALFPEAYQKQIKKVLNRDQIQFNNGSPGTITRMIYETADLIKKGGFE
jgi:hypothetical protein